MCVCVCARVRARTRAENDREGKREQILGVCVRLYDCVTVCKRLGCVCVCVCARARVTPAVSCTLKAQTLPLPSSTPPPSLARRTPSTVSWEPDPSDSCLRDEKQASPLHSLTPGRGLETSEGGARKERGERRTLRGLGAGVGRRPSSGPRLPGPGSQLFPYLGRGGWKEATTSTPPSQGGDSEQGSAAVPAGGHGGMGRGRTP